jgi:hypothetical protein
MLFIIPPSIDIDNTITQIKHEVFYEQSVTSTYLNNVYRVLPEEFNLSNWKRDKVYSTNLSLDNFEELNNSTWEEGNLSDFDLVTDVCFNKIIKVKSRIKAVTKYKPNVIID